MQKVIEFDKVMGMDLTITVTRKGQTTLPIAVRRRLGLAGSGGVLQAHLNEDTGELILTKAPSITELSERVSRHIKPDTRPLLDVNEFYQSERGAQP
jgi:bifunctional DNA-binding transcriptional regulator/antitoxin component of YhaV-PrlF toxin-antitoxin module